MEAHPAPVPRKDLVDPVDPEDDYFTPTPVPPETPDHGTEDDGRRPGPLAWILDPALYMELAAYADLFDERPPSGPGASFPMFCLRRFAPFPLHRLSRDQLLLFVDNLWTHLMPEIPWSWSQLFLAHLGGESPTTACWFLDRLVDSARRDPRVTRPQGTMRWDVGAARERGCQKSVQEDFVFLRSHARVWFCMVSDGVSRATIGSGQEASALVERTLQDHMPQLERALDQLGRDLPEHVWRTLAQGTLDQIGQWINAELIGEIRRRHPGPIGPDDDVMSVTSTMVMLRDSWCVVAQCGDSGAFLYQDGLLMPVTREHSVRYANILSSLLGQSPIGRTGHGVTHLLPNAADTSGVQVLIPAIGSLFTHTHLHLSPTSRLLVCTDGLIPFDLPRRVMLTQILRRIPGGGTAAQGADWILRCCAGHDCDDNMGLCWIVPA